MTFKTGRVGAEADDRWRDTSALPGQNIGATSFACNGRVGARVYPQDHPHPPDKGRAWAVAIRAEVARVVPATAGKPNARRSVWGTSRSTFGLAGECMGLGKPHRSTVPVDEAMR